MAERNDTLKVGEFARAIETLNDNNNQRFEDLRSFISDGFKRLEHTTREHQDSLHKHGNSLAGHEARLAILETMRAPHAAQMVRTHEQATSGPTEEGVIKISASKSTWAALAAVFSILQVLVLALAKKLGWVQ